jgi:hypothetical protein
MKTIFCKASLSFLTLLALMTFGASLVSQPAWAGTKMWDFEDAAQAGDWEVANGTWEIQDGVYKEISMAESAAHSLAGDVTWDNYTLEAKIRVDEHRYAGLAFRAQNEFEYYVFYIELNPEPNDLCFFKHKQGGFGERDRPEPNKTDASGEDIKHGEWFTMKIVVEGNEFTCFLNDKEMCVGSDNLGNEYTNGRVGVFAWQTRASFDDITVSGPGIEGTTTAVNPQNKLAITWGKLK